MTAETTPASTPREPELAGQTVVVIGGSAGIGLETARRARAEGAGVLLTRAQSPTPRASGAGEGHVAEAGPEVQHAQWPADPRGAQQLPGRPGNRTRLRV
jgi:NAD(P)-dependent dehydrogenase (short-subunit alcohol dehydrogenase family)